MFDNAGAKVRDYAKWLFWITLIGAVCASLVFGIEIERYSDGDVRNIEFRFGIFAAILISGALAAYIESLLLAAFGELVMNTRATAENTAKLVAIQSDNAAANANRQHNYSSGIDVAGKPSAPVRNEPNDSADPEASTQVRYDLYWELEKSLQFTSDKGCRDYLANKIDGMNDEAKKIIESKLRHYMQFNNPVGIRNVVREILNER